MRSRLNIVLCAIVNGSKRIKIKYGNMPKRTEAKESSLNIERCVIANGSKGSTFKNSKVNSERKKKNQK